MGGNPALGSVEWLEESGGILTRGQRMRLTMSAYRVLPRAATHRVRAEWWRRRPSKGDVENGWKEPTLTPLMLEAQQESERLLTPAMFNHSHRTWIFGRALAQRDGVELDDELLFLAAMLHDVGLCHPTFRACFTRLGARKVVELGRDLGFSADHLAPAAEAISHHITPGLAAAEGGNLGVYIQGGSALDLGGLRAIHLPVDFVRDVCTEWPFEGVAREAGARWRAESAMVKHGRAHHLQRWTRFSAISRITPLPP